jgi:hypothetical protein
MIPATVARVGALVVAVIAAANCGGEHVRLGDGPTGTDIDGGAGQNACQHGQVKANEVLWIGDSWVQIPNGIQHTRVRDLARAAGAIGPSDDYVDLAASASTVGMIASQYNTQEASANKVKVLIMDGGTWDTLVANASAASVTSALDTFTQLLAKVASDGTVEHVIYFLVPALPTIPGVAALRPGLEQACGASTVPCHFLDLQPLWAGHPEYTDPTNGIQASSAGATVIADGIWAIMQQNCIAQ